jgi:hypothetical protein
MLRIVPDFTGASHKGISLKDPLRSSFVFGGGFIGRANFLRTYISILIIKKYYILIKGRRPRSFLDFMDT